MPSETVSNISRGEGWAAERRVRGIVDQSTRPIMGTTTGPRLGSGMDLGLAFGIGIGIGEAAAAEYS